MRSNNCRSWTAKAFTKGLSLAFTVALASSCLAENRALILTIADYQPPVSPLPGVKNDAAIARTIAQSMGIPANHISALADRQLTLTGMREALRTFAANTKRGDNVFIYYSGHGSQESQPGNASLCREGLVPADYGAPGVGLMFDDELERLFSEISSKAARVVVMNDSCFSGGAATKSTSTPSVKRWIKSGVTERQCGDPVNKALTRAMSKSTGNMAYLAASTADEVSLILSDGSASTGTRAWEQCLSSAADVNRSGAITAQELTSCARQKVSEWHRAGRTPIMQTPVVYGATGLPIIFTSNVGASGASVNAEATFRDVIASASRSIRVSLTSRNPNMRIGQDSLDLNVVTDQAGYLTLFYLGSDGQSIDVLFPNDLDSNDYLQPGSHTFPRPNWRLRAGGPAGVNKLVAILSPERKDFRKYGTQKGAFNSQKPTTLTARNLVIEATGGSGDCKNLTPVAGGCGTFGASEILEVREVQ